VYIYHRQLAGSLSRRQERSIVLRPCEIYTHRALTQQQRLVKPIYWAERPNLGSIQEPERVGPPPDSLVADRFIAAHPGRWCGQNNNPDALTCRPLTTWPRSINRVVIHTIANPSMDAIVNRTAAKLGRGTSAHYYVYGDGTIVQMVREADVAFHARGHNLDSIGIEHADVCNDPAPYTTSLYERSAELVRDIAEFYGFEINDAAVTGHVDLGGHGDPGPYWDWEYYRMLLNWDGVTANSRPIRLVATVAGLSTIVSGWQVQRRRRISDTRCANRNDPYGARYWRSRPSATGTPAVLSLDVPEPGLYKASLWWPRVSGANSAVPVDIEVVSAFNPSLQTVAVNQRLGSGQWNDIGRPLEMTVLPARVEVRIRRDTEKSIRGQRDNDWILADAVRLLRFA